MHRFAARLYVMWRLFWRQLPPCLLAGGLQHWYSSPFPVSFKSPPPRYWEPSATLRAVRPTVSFRDAVYN